MKRLCLGLILSVFTSLPIAVAQDANREAAKTEAAQAEDAKTITAARKYIDDFMSGEMQSLVDHASPELKQLIKEAATLDKIREQTIGKAAQPIDDEVSISYTRRVKSTGGQVFEIFAQVARDGQLVGFRIQPAGEAPSEFQDYKTQADLRLPFAGTWNVFWGGRTIKENYHAISPEQRFAYDILQIRDGKSHRGTGKKNADYYCFGKTILAPGAGRVLGVVDGIADNAPGEMNPKEPCGNHVVLGLGNDEFLFIGHLKQGTVKVKPGDRVTPGQALGLRGNSGNSSEPHLHIHLQTTPDLANGKGLPLQFQRFQADGRTVERGEPTKGQLVAIVNDR